MSYGEGMVRLMRYGPARVANGRPFQLNRIMPSATS